jgi:type II secretory pathway component PulC
LTLVVWAATLTANGAQSPPPQPPPPMSALPLRLTGIIFDEGRTERSACLIQCLAQPERRGMIAVGQSVCDVAEVSEIREGAVLIRNLSTGRLELLTFQDATRAVTAPLQPEAPSPPEPDPVVLPAESVRAALANLPELLSSAVAVPRYRQTDGARAIEGFEVTQVQPSGPAERLGLRAGDVILDVNGQVLDGMPTVMRLFGELQATPRVTLTVVRDGRRVKVTFDAK